MRRFIVQSGTGYFLRFVNGTPLMTTDPLEAARLTADQVAVLVDRLGRIGMEAVPVYLRMSQRL